MHEPSVVLNFWVAIFFPRVFWQLLIAFAYCKIFIIYRYYWKGGLATRENIGERWSAWDFERMRLLSASIPRSKIHTNNNGVIAVSCDSWIIRALPLPACTPEWFQLEGGSVRVARKGRRLVKQRWKRGFRILFGGV